MNPYFWLENNKSKNNLLFEGVLEYKKSKNFFFENNLVCQNLGLQIQSTLNFVDNKIEDGIFIHFKINKVVSFVYLGFIII